MSDAPADFAKLFRVEGIGQILATLCDDKDENPCLMIRIPDANDCIVSMTITLAPYAEDIDAELYARTIFETLTAENISVHAAPLIAASKRLLGAGV